MASETKTTPATEQRCSCGRAIERPDLHNACHRCVAGPETERPTYKEGDMVIVPFGTHGGTQLASIERRGQASDWKIRIWRATSRRWTKTARPCDSGYIVRKATERDMRRVGLC